MKISVGDSITALGYTFEVGKIIYQDCFNGNYDVEFLDSHGDYHHWIGNLNLMVGASSRRENKK